MHLTLDSKSKAELLELMQPKNTLSTESPHLDSEELVIQVVDNTTPLWGTMLTLQENLNLRIGRQSWKKYINAAFWNYISTPINFTITLFTAMSAGQTGTESNYLSKNQLFYILFVSFVLSIINTFFKLKDKAIMNYDSLKKYQDFGAEFEKIYFTNVQNETMLMKKYYYYLDLQSKLNTYESTGSIEQVNYITEVIYFMFRCCFANRMKRLSFKERFWVLDGRPKEGYNHNFYTNMNKHFKRNFDLTSDSKKSGNTTLHDISGNKSSNSSNNVLVKFDIEAPEPNTQSKNRDNDEYDYRGSKFLQSANINTEVPDDEDLTEEEEDEDEQNDEEEEEEEEEHNDEKEDENRIDSICSEINTITKVHIFDALKEFYVNKKITEYDMIKRMMRESPEYCNYLYRFKIRKYLRRLKVPPVKATNEMKRLSEKIKKEYEKKEKTAKYMFNKTHGKKGVPPLNFRK
jgi:hypothetical protein